MCTHMHTHTIKTPTVSPSIREAEAGGSCELKTSLVYREFQTSKGYILRYCLENKTMTTTKGIY